MQKSPGRAALRRAFAKTIRTLRKNAGLAQEMLALETGLGRSYMGELERGLRTPTLETIFRLLPALHVDFVQFAEELLRNLSRESRDRTRA